jgi:hypothetical protein
MFIEPTSAYFGDFAVVATWQGASVSVIFDNEYIDNLGIAGTNPSALAKATDMPNVKSGQAISINSVNYIISQPPQPDGTGMVRLELRKA